MSVFRPPSPQLEPELRLADAISKFEADLSDAQKAEFRSTRSRSLQSPPDLNDVNRLTAELNLQISRKAGDRCYGTRFTSFLHGIQQFASIGDVTIGGSQNLLACGIWSLVRVLLLAVVSVSSYLDKLSGLIMEIGCSIPNCEAWALLYPKCASLRSFLSEYFIVVVRLCHHLLQFSQKSAILQFTSSLSDSDIQTFKTDLGHWTKLINGRAAVLMATSVEKEAQRNFRFRASSSEHSKNLIRQQKRAVRTQVLNFCSKYDHLKTWKQIRRIGNAAVFKRNANFLEWRDRLSSCTLLCHGTLGSGKSVLLANIVDDLHIHTRRNKTTVAYFFCRYDIPESLKARTILGSLARQLLSSVADLAMVAKQCDDSAWADDCQALLQVIFQALPSSHKAYFVVDGIDECGALEKEALARGIQKLQSHFNLLLCISYRLEPNSGIEAMAKDFAAPQNSLVLDDDSDIQAYVEAELSNCLQNGSLIMRDPTLILDIADALLKGSQGMFLWVALQIQSLCGMKTDQAIRDALANLPQNLAETFTRILEQSKRPGNSYQTQILQLVAIAQRPLTTDDLQEALSVVPGNTVWDPSNLLNDVYAALAWCGCLLAVDEEELTVRFVHSSVKQFVLDSSYDSSGTSFTYKLAHQRMADIVATYLNYGIFGTQLSATRVPPVMSQSLPSTIIRATQTSSSGIIQNLALKMLRNRKQPDFDISKTLAEARLPWNSEPAKQFLFYDYAKSYWQKHITILSSCTPILDRLIPKILRESGVVASLSNEDYRALLWWAVLVGHKRAMISCLDMREELNLRHNLQYEKAGMLLYLLARDNGYDEIAEQFLQKGVEVEESGARYDNALQAASKNGCAEAVRLLIHHHTNVNPAGGDYDPLQAASYYGFEQIVQMLIEAGADVNADGRLLGSALSAAARQGNLKIMNMLLDAGADIDFETPHGSSMLENACDQDHDEMVKLLVARGALAHLHPLLCNASHQGNIQRVHLLLDAGADMNATGESGETALQIACANGRKEVVELFIARGAHLTFHRTMFHTTSDPKQAQTVQFLLEQRATVDALNGADTLVVDYDGALQIASDHGHEEVVRLLVANANDENLQNALSTACRQGHISVAKTLLNSGADVNTASTLNGYALQAALWAKHMDVVQYLLEEGAHVNLLCGEHGLALHLAAQQGNTNAVKLLWGKGADINAQGGRYGSALQSAAFHGHLDTVKLLIELGADIYFQGGEYGNATLAAKYAGHEDIVALFTESATNASQSKERPHDAPQISKNKSRKWAKEAKDMMFRDYRKRRSSTDSVYPKVAYLYDPNDGNGAGSPAKRTVSTSGIDSSSGSDWKAAQQYTSVRSKSTADVENGS